jgi:hypothetical protein
VLNCYYKNRDASRYYQYKANKGPNLIKMEDDSIIKKVGIVKLNGLNYRTWVTITRVVIEIKDAWDAIEQLV